VPAKLTSDRNVFCTKPLWDTEGFAPHSCFS